MPSALHLAARRSYEGDGKYFKIALDSGAIVFAPEAYLLDFTQSSVDVACLVGRPHDVRGNTAVANRVQVRPIILTYPSTGALANDRAFTALFPIGDLILERSPSLAARMINRAQDVPMLTGYGVRHFRVGISCDTFMTIWNRTNAFLRDQDSNEDGFGQPMETWEDMYMVNENSSYFKVPELLDHDGHYWLLARVPERFKAVVHQDREAEEVKLTSFMEYVEKSLKCDAIAEFCLTKVGETGGWELDMTILSAAIVDTTDKTSQPRPNKPANHLVGRYRESSDEILQAFREFEYLHR